MTFDPMKDLLTAQSSKPSNLLPIDMHSLTPFQRALITIDGTVTKFIEAYTMESVRVSCLSQSEKILDFEHSWLDLDKSSPVTIREVFLQGEQSEKIYAYAVTLIAPDALDSSVSDGLKVEGGSIGRLLQNNKMETYREVLWYGRQRLNKLPKTLAKLNGTDFLSRTYRIISEGKPLMLINENFPLLSSID